MLGIGNLRLAAIFSQAQLLTRKQLRGKGTFSKL
jgi:hypothetical protein